MQSTKINPYIKFRLFKLPKEFPEGFKINDHTNRRRSNIERIFGEIDNKSYSECLEILKKLALGNMDPIICKHRITNFFNNSSQNNGFFFNEFIILDSDISDAKIHFNNIYGSYFKNTDLHFSIFEHCLIGRRTIFINCDLQNTIFNNCYWGDGVDPVEFMDSNLSGIKLNIKRIKNSKGMSFVNFKNCNIDKMDITECDLSVTTVTVDDKCKFDSFEVKGCKIGSFKGSQKFKKYFLDKGGIILDELFSKSDAKEDILEYIRDSVPDSVSITLSRVKGSFNQSTESVSNTLSKIKGSISQGASMLSNKLSFFKLKAPFARS